jgi:hypothetical protein
MPRDGAITFRDIAGKLVVLRITCDKCGRSGQYRVDRLIGRHGIDAKLFDWSDEITADCPRRQARNLNDQCGARCPDLPKRLGHDSIAPRRGSEDGQCQKRGKSEPEREVS